MLRRRGGLKVGAKKKLGRCPEEPRPNPDSRRVTEATQGERQPSHVHVTVAYLYSEAWLAVAHPRSARIEFNHPLTSEDVVPIGFCSGGFTSTSSLRSGQRGSTEVERLSLPRRLITPSARRRVFIRAAREAPVGIFPAQTFRPRPGRQWQRRLPLVAVLRSKRFRPNLPIPTPVTTAVTIATGAGLYARARGLSRLFYKKYTGRN